MAEYISHIIGSITEHEYEVIDKPFSPEFLRVFKPNRRIVPSVLIIEKRFGGKTLVGKQIEDYLLSLGFTKSVSKNAMRVFSANKWVNEHLEKEGYPIEDLAYTKQYAERVRILFPGKLLIDTRWAREDVIFVRPLKVSIIECSQFTIIDAFGGSESKRVEESITHSINHREKLNVLITPDQYDEALRKARKQINDIIVGFFGIKNPHLKWKNIEDLHHSRGYNEECPENRTYEFDIVLSDSLEIAFSMVYSKGKVVSVTGNVPLNKVVPILKSIGAWEK